MTSLQVQENARLSSADFRKADRNFARSPHAYHRRSDSLVKQDLGGADVSPDHEPSESSESSTERGTEADDEKGSILRLLPAAPLQSRKGMRGRKTPVDLTPAISPFPTPPAIEEKEGSSYFSGASQVKGKSKKQQRLSHTESLELYQRYVQRRRAEVVRRLTETVLLGAIGVIACGHAVRTGRLQGFKSGFKAAVYVLTFVYFSYPVRTVIALWNGGTGVNSALRKGFHIPSRFDPGSLLYPVLLPVFISTCLTTLHPALIIVNLVLGLSSIPQQIIPCTSLPTSVLLHWILSVAPLTSLQRDATSDDRHAYASADVNAYSSFENETLVLLFPLHQTLLVTLKYLTTTSLDASELQLLSVGLINLWLFAASPQAHILRGILWIGGLSLFVSCQRPLRLELSLARVPAWKFARNKVPKNGVLGRIEKLLNLFLPHHRYSRSARRDSDDGKYRPIRPARRDNKPDTKSTRAVSNGSVPDRGPSGLKVDEGAATAASGLVRSTTMQAYTSRYLVSTGSSRSRSSTTRTGILSLTLNQAQALKWLIAGYVYVIVVLVILLIVRHYVGEQALSSTEPFGWAIGYLFGNIPQFRLWVVTSNVENWIKLPDHITKADHLDFSGWLERLRQVQLGAANMRLVICGYCLLVLGVGIAAVLQLRAVVEVDTRRKVFHGIMVAMLLPTIAIDPCFTSLALVLILAIFLLLDLFRASQLPPISKPLTTFLAPYVDGRDYRGPVIVSHIFLLIGCAIPLWLSLAGSPRTGQGPWRGWETNVRDVSMVSGVICVGMGDAAASLIGRRYGRTRWFWGGGKSLEGSFAFALAVTVGLMASHLWLRVGGWVDYESTSLPQAIWKAIVAASGASLLESVLTAANDNVVVPVGLWLLVRGLEL